ncbi:MAG TPA: type II toxin-antitoxin system VapC family toxin, partial [Candidatus Dormibacteraeota bacterium]|nr:type II toxin-antitoxin system VapC family toxin [Candidatus Dormibacteraeota bacterium]
IVREEESDALGRFLSNWPDRAAASLLRTETIRALRRSGHDLKVGPARRLLGTVHLIRLEEPLLDHAGDLEPRDLRSLDAVHLAAAMSLGPELGAFVCYDRRLAEGAIARGLPVVSPA